MKSKFMKSYSILEEIYIIRLYGKQSDTEIAERLGRTPVAVKQHANAMGIQKRTKDDQRKELERNKTREMIDEIIKNEQSNEGHKRLEEYYTKKREEEEKRIEKSRKKKRELKNIVDIGETVYLPLHVGGKEDQKNITKRYRYFTVKEKHKNFVRATVETKNGDIISKCFDYLELKKMKERKNEYAS